MANVTWRHCKIGMRDQALISLNFIFFNTHKGTAHKHSGLLFCWKCSEGTASGALFLKHLHNGGNGRCRVDCPVKTAMWFWIPFPWRYQQNHQEAAYSFSNETQQFIMSDYPTEDEGDRASCCQEQDFILGPLRPYGGSQKVPSAFSIVWHSVSFPLLSVLSTNLVAQIQLMCVK